MDQHHNTPATCNATRNAARRTGGHLSAEDAASRGYMPSHPAGRGWIPGSRDIGLPDDDLRGARPEPRAPAGPPEPTHTIYDYRTITHTDGRREVVVEARDVDAATFAAHCLDSGGSDSGGAESGGADAGSDIIEPCAAAGGGAGALAPAPATRLPARGDAFSGERRVRFLQALAESGNARAACAAEGISAQTAYLLRRRDAAFAAGWDAALVLGREISADALADRALNGVEEAIYYRGELVGSRRRFDSRLLLAHLARLDKLVERDGLAVARAGRFDELLAVVAGAEPPAGAQVDAWVAEDLEGGDEVAARAPDPLLPPAREDFADRAAHAALLEICGGLGEEGGDGCGDGGGVDGGGGVGPDELARIDAARNDAAARHDGWSGRVAAIVDAALAGEPLDPALLRAPAVQGEEAPGEEAPGEEAPGEEAPGEEASGDEMAGEEVAGEAWPPMEYKSLHGPAPCPWWSPCLAPPAPTPADRAHWTVSGVSTWRPLGAPPAAPLSGGGAPAAGSRG